MVEEAEADEVLASACCTNAIFDAFGADESSRACGTVGSLLLPVSVATGNAFDLILVQSSTSGLTACNEPTFSFGSGGVTTGQRVVLEVESSTNNSTPNSQALQLHDRRVVRFHLDEGLNFHLPPVDSGAIKITMSERNQQESRHDQTALQALANILQSGCNSGRYLLLDESDAVVAAAMVNIRLWSDQDRIAVVDIDGTITKSNIRGVFDTVLTQNYIYCHDGVCELLSRLPKDFRVVYLTARPISLSDKTRDFLSSLRQADHGLPEGALIGFTGSLAQMIFMELVYKSANVFKKEALQRHIVSPFNALGSAVRFGAAFGNTLMDMEAYHTAGINLHSMYLIDKKSIIYCLDGKQLRPDVLDRQEFYLSARGTSFSGYRDHRLLSRILERIT